MHMLQGLECMLFYYTEMVNIYIGVPNQYYLLNLDVSA